MDTQEFNIQESFGFHFNMIFFNIKKLMETRLKSYNLTYLQFSILINLYKNNLTTQKEILQYTNGDEASITRLIDRLELKGYLKRVTCTDDKRKKKIILTKNGILLTKKAIQCAIEVNQELIKDLDENESNELLRLLKKVHFSSKS
jgi:DNA-binding MarR family transcriptional regulator